MSDVTVPFGDDAGKTATVLLAAAEKLHEDQSLVRTQTGAFLVPKDVADEAGVDYESDEDDDEADEADEGDEKSASKTAAKKTAAKK